MLRLTRWMSGWSVTAIGSSILLSFISHFKIVLICPYQIYTGRMGGKKDWAFFSSYHPACFHLHVRFETFQPEVCRKRSWFQWLSILRTKPSKRHFENDSPVTTRLPHFLVFLAVCAANQQPLMILLHPIAGSTVQRMSPTLRSTKCWNR